MKKFVLVLVIFILTILFIVSAAAGALLTARTIGWDELVSVSRITDWSSQWNYSVQDFLRFFDRRAGERFDIDQTKSISAEQLSGISEIHITALSEEVTLTTDSDSVDARISGTYFSISDLTWEVQINGNRLNIRTRYPKYGFRSQNLKMDIVVPAEFSGKVFLNTLSGNCRLPDQTLYDWQALIYDGMSARLEIEQASMQQLSLTTLSGDLIVKNASAPVQISSMSGKVDLQFMQTNNAVVETMSGQVRISSPADSPVQLQFRTLSGDFNFSDNPFSLTRQQDRTTEGILYNGDGSEYTWNIETMSGNLTIP